MGQPHTAQGATPAPVPTRGGPADVVYLLLLLQTGFGLLAMVGELLFMGNPLYALVPVGKAVAVFVIAAKVVSGRRWAWITVIVIEGLGLVGVWLSLLAWMLPVLTRTVTLVGLLTEIALPVTVIVLCGRLLARPRPVARLGGQWPPPSAPAGPAVFGRPGGLVPGR